MKCALCYKPLPNRQNRKRYIQFKAIKDGRPYEYTILVHKDCAGVYKLYTDMKAAEYKASEEFRCIRERLAKAAGHPVPDTKRPFDLKWPKPDNKNALFQNRATNKTATEIGMSQRKGRKADFVIMDDLDPIDSNITYDKEFINKVWTQMRAMNDNQLKGVLNGTNSANTDDRPTSNGRSNIYDTTY